MVVHADVPQVPVELGSANLGSGRGHPRAQGAPLELRWIQGHRGGFRDTMVDSGTRDGTL